MRRGWSLFWVGLMIAVAVVTYAMKDSAGRAADHVMQLKAEISREKQQLSVLRAEWGVLDQPARLQGLVARYNEYLALKPIDVRQLATIADIPARAPGGATGSIIDDIRTGAITAPAKPKVAKPAGDRPASAKPASDKPVVAKRRPPAPAPKVAAPAPAAPAQLETGFLQ